MKKIELLPESYSADSQGIFFIRYEMPIVLRMHVFHADKLFFRLL